MMTYCAIFNIVIMLNIEHTLLYIICVYSMASTTMKLLSESNILWV